MLFNGNNSNTIIFGFSDDCAQIAFIFVLFAEFYWFPKNPGLDWHSDGIPRYIQSVTINMRVNIRAPKRRKTEERKMEAEQNNHRLSCGEEVY